MDGAEVNTHKTHALIPDTDGDGLSDGEEVNIYGTSPLKADTDDDGLSDKEELSIGTSPINPDFDDDGSLDGSDNCPKMANLAQINSDSDQFGDACDNCPIFNNADQNDSDSDGAGDACDCDDGLKGPYEYGVDCGGSCPYCTHQYTFINDYPRYSDNGIAGEIQGVAHDEYYWYFTQAFADDYSGWITKIPVIVDLNTVTGTDPSKDILAKSMPPELRYPNTEVTYWHFGDLDYFNGKLYVPIESQDEARRTIIAIFRASDLQLLAYDYMDQTRAGWCSINPMDGKLYSSLEVLDADNPLFIYEIVDLPTESHYIGFYDFLSPSEKVTLLDKTGIPITLYDYMQGGEFSDDGLLYLLNGRSEWDGHIDESNRGIKVFDIQTWRLVVQSCNRGCAFNYEFHPWAPSWEEPEGLTIWDVDALTNKDPNISGQLHAILYENLYNNMYLKHYRIE
jgi:hypothetical protein